MEDLADPSGDATAASTSVAPSLAPWPRSVWGNGGARPVVDEEVPARPDSFLRSLFKPEAPVLDSSLVIARAPPPRPVGVEESPTTEESPLRPLVDPEVPVVLDSSLRERAPTPAVTSPGRRPWFSCVGSEPEPEATDRQQ